MTKQEFELKRQNGETLRLLVANLSKWVPLCVIAYYAFRAIEALSGRATIASFGLFLLADLKANSFFSHAITTIFGASGVAYGLKERRVRRKNIERMSKWNMELEQLSDVKRTSSRLTSKGVTNPKDRT